MKKDLYHYLLVTFSMILLMSSCRKDRAIEQYTELSPAIKPDLTIKITSSVTGFVTDENDKPVFAAKVIAGNKQTTTDEYGYFSISNALLSETAGFVKITSTGYFNGYKTFIPKSGKESFVRLKLVPSTNAGIIDAVAGGTITTPDNARIVLPANSVVLAAGSTPYTGPVNVAMQWIDASDVGERQLSAPGDARGLDTKDHLVFVRSFGTLAVELTGSGGQLLQIANGRKATISIPLPASMSSGAPASIPLWSFDETKGLWKEEGVAMKNGAVYTGEVSHFSFWDGAIGMSLVNLTVQVTDAALHPLSNVAVGVRFAGQPFNAGGGTFAYTDANGFVTGGVPANSNLVLLVLTPCATESYSHNFTTGNSSVDLGTVTGNLGQSVVTISGNVVDCNNQPVTNGYVQTFDNGFFSRATIVNGSFSFTGVACTNTVTNIVAVDNNTNQQSTVQTITLVTGANPLGTLSACGTSTLGVINYTIDGVSKTLIEPANPLNAYFSATAGGWTTVIHLMPSPGTPDISFQFDGMNIVGNNHKVTDIFCVGFSSGRALAPVPLTVIVTEFGSPGGFISGQFSGQVNDFTSGTPHTINCDFRVRRYN